jgi:hypothetical protein
LRSFDALEASRALETLYRQGPDSPTSGEAGAGVLVTLSFDWNALFAKIRADKPFKLQAGNTGIGSVTDPHKPTASPTPGPTASGSPSPASPSRRSRNSCTSCTRVGSST